MRILFLAILIFAVSKYSRGQEKQVAIKNVVVYQIDINTCAYNPYNVNSFGEEDRYCHIYKDKHFGKNFYREFSDYVNHMDTLKKVKERPFYPFFLIRYSTDKDSSNYILLGLPGAGAKTNQYNKYDSTLATGKILFNLLWRNVKAFKKEIEREDNIK